MAKIEVVTDIDINQVHLDNDLMRIALSELFTSKYFMMYKGGSGVAPVDMFPRTPCAYMVYMDASFIPFGRDFLNTHVAALVKDPRPIVYWHGEKLAIAVMHARSYLKVFQETGNTKKTFIEENFVIRAVAKNALLPLINFYGDADIVERKYTARMHNDETFALTDFNDLLVQYSPLLGTACDGNHTLLASKSKASAGPRLLKQKPEPPNNFFSPLFRKNHQSKGTLHVALFNTEFAFLIINTRCIFYRRTIPFPQMEPPQPTARAV